MSIFVTTHAYRFMSKISSKTAFFGIKTLLNSIIFDLNWHVLMQKYHFAIFRWKKCSIVVLFTFMSSWFLFLGVLCPHKYSQMQLFTFFLSFGSKYSSLMTISWWLKWTTLKYELAILNINWIFDRRILKTDRSINLTRQGTAALSKMQNF